MDNVIEHIISNHDDFVDTVVDHSSTTTGDFSLCISKKMQIIAEVVDYLFE